ncbi:MAG: energy transducer TonB [Polyangiaceae bacterium]
MTSIGVSLAALGTSAMLHAALLLVPLGHASALRGMGDPAVAAEVAIDPADSRETPAPEPIATPPAALARNWLVPRDPNLVHPYAPATNAPAQAAPAEATNDDMPHFTIAVGEATSAYGAVSSLGSAPPHEGDINAAPMPEASVDGRAQLVAGVSPAYSDAARADGIEGDVRLELVVGVSGAVESARVVLGIGHGLDEAALRAVRQYRFAPALKAGYPVRVRMVWSMQFRLR